MQFIVPALASDRGGPVLALGVGIVTKPDRREGESSMKADDQLGVEQRREGHERALVDELGGLDRDARAPKRGWPNG